MRWLRNLMRTRPLGPSRSVLRLEHLESRETPSFTSGSGVVLPHVEAQALFYGAAWSGNPQVGQFETFTKYLVNSPYMDMLTTAGYGVGRGTWSSGIIYNAH